MNKKTIAALLLAVSAAFSSLPAMAAEPTLHEVYQAAEAGRLGEAQGMMSQVLKEHPNSGKAHFVEAELLAKQGDFTKAREELANAERLAPGLPFAKPQAVENLKSLLRGNHSANALQPAAISAAPVAAATASGVPWGMLLGGLGLIAFIIWAVRLMASRSAPAPMPAPAGGVPTGYGPASQAYGYGAPVPATGGGLGSSIMGGLATGAAVGAGVVAGEAIARHFMHDDEAPVRHDSGSNFTTSSDNVFNDMGGSDFGVADGGSWDDGGSSSDSDWN